MSGSNAIPLTIGETLQMSLAFANDDGSPFDLTGYTVASQVSDLLGNWVDTLGITWFSAAPNLASVSQGTDYWPAGTLLCDVMLTQAGSNVVTYSCKFSFVASAPVTLATAPPVLPA